MKDSISVTRFPLQGEWKAVKSPGHHKYAYDFCAVNAGRLYRSKNTFHLMFSEVPAEESYSWVQTVYAPVSGTILEASDGWKDRMTLKSNILPFHCNYERWNKKQWESVNGESILKGDTLRNVFSTRKPV